MPDQEPLTYTVTPGPAVLRKMGLSWTLFGPAGAHLATFSHGPGGEPPGPVDLTLSEELAAELAEAGYAVQALSGVWPEPVNDVQVSRGLEGVEPEQPGNDVLTVVEANLLPSISVDLQGREETLAGEPGEGIQVEPGIQADGSPTEAVGRRRKEGRGQP